MSKFAITSLKHQGDIGKTIPMRVLAHGNVDSAIKGKLDRSVPEAQRKLSDRQLALIDKAAANGTLSRGFNTGTFLLRRVEPA